MDIGNLLFMNNKLLELFEKLRNGTISTAEKKLLDTWYIHESKDTILPENIENKIYEHLKEMKNFQLKDNIKHIKPRVKYTAIAATILLLLIGSWYMATTNNNQQIAIGSSKANLTFSTGEKIDLEHMKANDHISIKGINISKSSDGFLKYTAQETINEKPLYNTLSTPRGGEYKIVLVDGTKVWLNTKSTLRFFANAPDKERKVWLQGEAYFEVAHNKMKPFRIYTEQQEIKVLGTKFNIRASHQSGQTTLLEGKVSINNESIILAPGQQLTTTNRLNQKVKYVDVEPFLAWKNGYFFFNNDSLIKVMSEIADWYDIQIEFIDPVQDVNIWATVSRYRSIHEVLDIFEKTGVAHFDLKGRRLEIRK